MSERRASPERRRRRRHGQRGHLMAGLVAMVAIMMIFSAMAFQAWEDILHRDHEAEMIFRAKDIVRAIQRYRRDHGGQGPQKLEDLMEPGPKGQYYLRQLYEDPLADDGKWGLLYAGPGGQIIDPNAQPDGTELGLGQPGFGQGQQPGQPGQQPGGLPGFGNQNQNNQGQGQPGPGQSQGFPTTQSGSGAFSPEGSVAGGQQMSGLPIAGVKSLSDEKPFRVYKGFTSYSEWLFTYFDLEIPQQGSNQNQNQNNQNNQGNPPVTQP